MALPSACWPIADGDRFGDVADDGVGTVAARVGVRSYLLCGEAEPTEGIVGEAELNGANFI
jgi:hypothetical protein